MTAPRLHVLVARDRKSALVLRRGPSKQVASIGWRLKDDEFNLGQWLKGRIYVYRADLSPDGRHMIYFAMNGRWHDDMGGSWTAVSRAPWLTALHVYPWGDCWNGGGLFLDNRRYWLNGGGTHARAQLMSSDLERSDTVPEGLTPSFGECPVVYLPKLVRDGWQEGEIRSEAGVRIWQFDKYVRDRWTLRKFFHSGPATGPNRECYYETHELVGPSGTVPIEGAEWADVLGARVVFARDGALWRIRVHAKGSDDPDLIRDFTDMRFETRNAPYHGVPQEGAR